jgi:hypothetical protein
MARKTLVIKALFHIAILYSVVILWTQILSTVIDTSAPRNGKALLVLERKTDKLTDVLSYSQTLAPTPAPTPAPTQEDKNGMKLPSCRTLMQQPGLPYYANADFITRHTTNVSWTPRADYSRQFDLANDNSHSNTNSCTLHRYSAQEARQCLAGNHINFIGDSLTRYQFLSLAHFIHKGEYPPRFGLGFCPTPVNATTGHRHASCSPNGQPNILMPRDWNKDRPPGYDSLLWFHGHLGGWVDGGIFDGQMQFSGCKSNIMNCSENGRNCSPENELYASKSDQEGVRVLISYIQENGWGDNPNPVRGFNFTDCSYNGTCRRSKEVMDTFLRRAEQYDYDFDEPLQTALNTTSGILRKQLPPVNITIYNRGLWGVLKKGPASKIMPLLFDFAGGESGRCFFKSTTASSRESTMRAERGHVRNETLKAGCSFLDIGHVTEEFASLEGV